MRRSLRTLAAAAVAATLALALVSGSRADTTTLKVVVNAENPMKSLSRADLVRIYLGKKTLWENGQRVQPAMLDEDQAEIRTFIEKDVKRTVDQYRAYWKHMLFSGGGTSPRTFRSGAQVLDFVAREPGAIGLVVAPRTDDKVRVLEITED